MNDFLKSKKLAHPFVLIKNNSDNSSELFFHKVVDEEFDSFREQNPLFQLIKTKIYEQITKKGFVTLVTGTAACQRIFNSHSYLMEFSKNDITFFNSGIFGLVEDFTTKQGQETTVGKSKIAYVYTLPLKKTATIDDILTTPPQKILSTSNKLKQKEETGLVSICEEEQISGIENKKLAQSLLKIKFPENIKSSLDISSIDEKTLNLKGFIPQYDQSSNCYARSPLLYIEAKMGTRLFEDFKSFIIEFAKNCEVQYHEPHKIHYDIDMV